MAISSIHIQPASAHCYAHNDRSEKVSYLVDDSANNECDRNAIEARALLLSMVKNAEKYRKENGLRAMKSDTVKTVEAVVNLNAGHTLADVQKLARAIEKEFGFRPVQIAVHRDEGKDKQNKNYHAHIVMCNLTPQGTTIQRTLGKDGLSKLQDLTANELGMSRGDPLRKAPRLSAREYKKHAKVQEANEIQTKNLTERLRLEQVEHEKTLQKLLKTQKEAREYQTLAQELKIENKRLSDENTTLKEELELLKKMYDEDRQKLKASGQAKQEDYQKLKIAYEELQAEVRANKLDEALKEFQKEHPSADWRVV